MKTITIGIDGSCLSNPKSGTGRYTIELIKAIAANKGISVTVLLPRKGIEKSLSDCINLEFTVDKSWLWSRLPILLWIRFRLSKIISPKQFDYLICPITIVPQKIRRETKIISIVHDINHLIIPESMTHGTRIMHHLFFRRSLFASSFVLVNSSATKKLLYNLMGISADLVVYPPLINNYDLPPQDISFIHPDLKKDKYILYVGTIEPRKNLLPFIDAFLNIQDLGLYRNFKFVIAGSYGWRSGKVMRLMRMYPNQVVHLSHVDDEKLNKLYTNTFAVVLPSLYEGYGMTAAEANLFGARLLATDIQEVREAAQNNGIFVEPTLIGFYRGLIETLGTEKKRPANDKRFHESVIKISDLIGIPTA